MEQLTSKKERELSISDVIEYYKTITDYPELVNKGYYYYNDEETLNNFLIEVSVVSSFSDEVPLETKYIDLVVVYNWLIVNK